MNNTKMKKKKMNTYLKWFLILFCSACVGGVIGAMSESFGLFENRDFIGGSMSAFWLFIRSHMLFLLLLCGIVCGIFCEKTIYQMKKTGLQMQDTEDDLIDQLEYQLEVLGGRGMIASTVGCILLILIVAPGYSLSYIRSQSTGETGIYLTGLLAFIALEAYFGLWQIRYIKLIQKIYPEKKGDPSSVKFQKQWLESCDEAEKECIYQAAYRTYLIVGKSLPVITFLAMFLHMLWNTGLLAIVIAAGLWLLNSVSYCRYCVTKKQEKIAG